MKMSAGLGSPQDLSVNPVIFQQLLQDLPMPIGR